MKKAAYLSLTLVTLALTACWSGNSNWSITSTKIDSQFDALTPAESDVQASLESLRKRDLNKALVQVEGALEKDPDLVSGLNVAGLIYEQLGAVNLAEVHFNNALRVDRNDPITRNNYGTFLCNLGRIYEAEAQFVIAASNPDYKAPEEAYTNAGLCARKIPDIDRAAYYFQAAVQKNPKYGPALFQLAGLNFQDGRFLQARQDIARYLDSGEPGEKGLWLAARIERELSNRVGVQFYAEQLRQRFPDSQEAKLATDLETKLTGVRPHKPLPPELQAMVDREKSDSAEFEEESKDAPAQESQEAQDSPGRGLNFNEIAQIPPATSLLETLPGGTKPAAKGKKAAKDNVAASKPLNPAGPATLPEKESSLPDLAEAPEVKSVAPAKPGASAAAEAELSDGWLAAQPGDHYTLTLHAEDNLAALRQYAQSSKLKGPLGYYRYQIGSNVRYGLLYGDYKSQKDAEKAKEKLPRAVAVEGPAVMQFGKLQLANDLALQHQEKQGSAAPQLAESGAKPTATAAAPSAVVAPAAAAKSAPSESTDSDEGEELPLLSEAPAKQASTVRVVPKPGMGIAPLREDWLLSRKPSSYTVQLVADRRQDTVLNYARKHKLKDQAALFSFKRDGDTWYALVYGDYDSRAEAKRAAMGLSGSTPWIRSLNEVQSLIRQSATQ